MVIVEKEAKGARSRTRGYARALASYMQTARRNLLAQEYGVTLAGYLRVERRRSDEEGERVLAYGARVSGQVVAWEAAMAEMNARLAKRSSRSKKPARHIVASYRADEQPDAEGCEEVVRTLAEELGCDAGLLAWALHGDTDNAHLHVLVLTLDTEGAATPYGPRGQSHEAMQRAIARLEHAQHLTPEPGSRYEADARGVRRRAATPDRPKRRAPIPTKVLQHEAETGVESFTRYAQDVLADHLDRATSWGEAQARLAKHGAIVWKAGSGGEIRSGDGLHKVKLSSVDRKLSWDALTSRWGDWSGPDVDVKPYWPRILDQDQARRWLERDVVRDGAHGSVQGWIDRLKAERAAAMAALKERYTAQRQDLADLSIAPELAVGMRDAWRSASARHLADTAAAYHNRIAALRELRQEVDDDPEPGDIDLPEIAVPDCSLAIAWSGRADWDVALPGYHTVRIGEATQYWARDEAARRPAFVERGDRIWMNDTSDAALRAALIVAKARYSEVMAFGDAQFIRRTQMLGAELRIDVDAGARPMPRPHRQRSPRVTQRREVVRSALAQVDADRRVQRSHTRLLEMLLSEPDEPGDWLCEALPDRPPDRIRELDETAAKALAAVGILVTSLRRASGTSAPIEQMASANTQADRPSSPERRASRSARPNASGMER